MEKIIILTAALLLGGTSAHAYDTSKNPDQVPSFGMDLWKGQTAGLDRTTVETNGGLVGGLLDFRAPISNAFSIHAFAEGTGINNNLRYTDGYKIGAGVRIFLQD